MKIVSVCVSFVIIIIVCQIVVARAKIESHNGEEIQIATINDKSLTLDLDKFSEMLNADDIKNRSIVVVSIVGAHKIGKSFLMNFFIRYLEAQVTININ